MNLQRRKPIGIVTVSFHHSSWASPQGKLFSEQSLIMAGMQAQFPLLV